MLSYTEVPFEGDTLVGWEKKWFNGGMHLEATRLTRVANSRSLIESD